MLRSLSISTMLAHVITGPIHGSDAAAVPVTVSPGTSTSGELTWSAQTQTQMVLQCVLHRCKRAQRVTVGYASRRRSLRVQTTASSTEPRIVSENAERSMRYLRSALRRSWRTPQHASNLLLCSPRD